MQTSVKPTENPKFLLLLYAYVSWGGQVFEFMPFPSEVNARILLEI